ncbi:hypothetical protein G9A89_007499 [Geosiphon pyriformis]|nr:hypothetical protein G9A89_007499 [Geosiphon pyriformis]
MTYIGKFNKLLKQICQLETNDYYFDAQILDQFITGLKDKLIKKHAKRYEMVMEEANHIKLMNLAIGETSSAAEEKIDQLTKKVENYFTNQQQQQPQRYQPPQRQNQNNFVSSSNNQLQNCYYYQQNRSNQCYPSPQQSYYQPPLPSAYYPPRPQYQTDYYQSASQPMQQQLVQQNQFAPQNRFTTNNNKINPNNQLPRLTHYHTQPSYLTIPEEQNFYHTALLEAKIAENANLSDIFSFKFKANESPFLLSNAATNKQKAITAIYTKAEVEKKAICLILDSGSAKSIITYQLIQQLKRNTPVEKIDNFPFTLDRIIIPVKVLVMNTSQYQALVGNNWLQKANIKLDWKTQELQLSYQEQHAQVPATCEKTSVFEFEKEEKKPVVETFMALKLTSNWAEETKQTYFATNSYPEEPETPG